MSTERVDNIPGDTERDKDVDLKKESVEVNTDSEIENSTKDLDIDSNSVDDKEDKKEPKEHKHPGIDNLVPQSERTKEEQRKIARLGGIRSGEVRKARKTAREILQEMLQRQLSDGQIDDILGTSKSLLGEEKTAYAVINAKMIQVAAAGDTKAYNAVRDTVGDAPVQEQRIETINTPGDMALYEKVAKRLEQSNKKTDEKEEL